MVESVTITDTAIEALGEAAERLQAYYLSEEGHCYPLDGLTAALARWLESSAEELAQEAFFHAVEGRDDYVFNRIQWSREMSKLTTKEPYATD